MEKELKRAIINFIIDNEGDLQLTNNTTHKFGSYIYDSAGNYIIGGEKVSDFIENVIKIITA